MAKRKFKFVEDFINPDTGQPYEGFHSPQNVSSYNFGTFEGHQIAKIKYEEKKIKVSKTIVDGKGNATTTEEEKTITVERMGQVGGWIEKMENLSQEGECWVEDGGYILGGGFLYGDAILSSGDIGEFARVGDEAEVTDSCGIGGNAHVFGKAKVGGSQRIAVFGTARVRGKVLEDATVFGNAYVGETGEAKGKAEISGDSILMGTAKDNANVSGRAVVYGTVTKAGAVSKDGFVGGTVDKNAVVNGGVIQGTVTDDVVVPKSNVLVTRRGSLIKDASIQENVAVDGTVNQGGKASGNVLVGERGNIKDATAAGNTFLDGTMFEATAQGGPYIGGSLSRGTAYKGSRIGQDGLVGNGVVMDGANCGGENGASMEDGCVLIGTNVGSMEGGSVCVAANVASMEDGSVDVGGNGIALYGSMVYVEDEDQYPGESAAVVEVEP